jgi:hypothetical protein
LHSQAQVQLFFFSFFCAFFFVFFPTTSL